eukprot:gene15626-6910_t
MVFLSTGCTIGLDQPELKRDFKDKNKAQNEVNIEMKENVPEGNNNNLPPVDESNQQLAMGAVLDSYITNSSVATQKEAKVEAKCEEDDKSIEDRSETKATNEEQTRPLPGDEKYIRLKSLLDRSNVYAQFVLKQIEHQRQQDKVKKEERKKSKEKRAAELAKKKEDTSDQIVPDVDSHQTRSGRQPAKRVQASSTKENKKRKRNDEKDQQDGARNSPKKSRKSKSKNEDEGSPDHDTELSADIHTDDSENSKTRTFNGEIISDRQPILVSGGLMRSYQLDGLEWMRGLFENGINGILADEMGLGKTLQCISLLSYFIERGMRGPFLIAAPLSTLPNWVSEFKKFAPKIKTLLYHGSKDERHIMRQKILKLGYVDQSINLKAYPVVITSYEIIMRDRAALNVHPWKYIIIDEGHRIKNLNCRLISELKTYKNANRLLLTGTPLQNNLSELWSLLNFLLPDIFDDLKSFEEWFDFSAIGEDDGDEKLIAQEQEAHVLETLHAILTPFLLRRLKTDVDLTIPPKRELIVYAPLTAEQEEFYKGTLDKTILDKLRKKQEPEPQVVYTPTGRPKRRSTKNVNYQSMLAQDSESFDFDELLEKMTADEESKMAEARQKAKAAEKKTSVVSIKLQNILMQLRKCCNHPYLLEHPLDPETNEYVVNESIVKVSGKMKLLDKMLPELKKRGHKVLIFSQMTRMLDLIEDFCHLRDYDYSRIDGTMSIPDRQEMASVSYCSSIIERFNNDSGVFLFLLSTRAGGLGLNLSAADTCIIYDSDWNPQVDLQAQDRCHRIGQTKPVLIFRYVTANSVDEKVVERAASKRKLEKMVIHKGRFKGRQTSHKLSPEELLELLKSNDHSHVSDIGDDLVISDECLNRLLDRSALEVRPEARTKEDSTVESDLFKIVEQSQEDVLF